MRFELRAVNESEVRRTEDLSSVVGQLDGTEDAAENRSLADAHCENR